MYLTAVVILYFTASLQNVGYHKAAVPSVSHQTGE